MKSIQENEKLNTLILSQILTEDIYIIPEKGTNPTAKTEQIIDTKEKPVVGDLKSLSETKLSNTKEIIVVLEKPAAKEELEFLSKILSALKLTLNDVSLIVKTDFSPDLNFKKLISFNVSIESILDLKAEKYILKDFNKTKVLLADSLQELTMDVKKKKQLWDSLQQMFGLK